MSMVFYHWGSRSSETACVRAPASGLGGGRLGYRQYDREREAVAGAAALVPRQSGPPPPTSQRIIASQFEGYIQQRINLRVP